MALRATRFRVAISTLRYREAWTLHPRASLGLLRSLLALRPAWGPAGAELCAYTPPAGGEAFRRYLRGLTRMRRGDRVPLIAHISVTDRCPNRCARCSNLTHSLSDPRPAALRRLARDLRDAGAARIALTGGEPLVRDDLEAIIDACGRDLAPLLFTSGYGLDRSRARALRAAGLTAAFISLDADAACEHDAIRGRAGAFDEALAAIDSCRAAGLYTAAQAVVTPPLLRDGGVERSIAFCARLRVDEVMLLEHVPVRSDDDTDFLAGADRARLAALHARSARDRAMPKVSTMAFLEGPGFLGCQAGVSFIHVNAAGEVLPCDFVPLSFGNAFAVGLDEILARLASLLARPSRVCLARRIRDSLAGVAARPVPWEVSREILRGYDPGDLPGLARYFHV